MSNPTIPFEGPEADVYNIFEELPLAPSQEHQEAAVGSVYSFPRWVDQTFRGLGVGGVTRTREVHVLRELEDDDVTPKTAGVIAKVILHNGAEVPPNKWRTNVIGYLWVAKGAKLRVERLRAVSEVGRRVQPFSRLRAALGSLETRSDRAEVGKNELAHLGALIGDTSIGW